MASLCHESCNSANRSIKTSESIGNEESLGGESLDFGPLICSCPTAGYKAAALPGCPLLEAGPPRLAHAIDLGALNFAGF